MSQWSCPNPFSIKRIALAPVLLAAGIFMASAAEARVSGDVELRYVDFTSEVNGAKLDAHTFEQRYSLLYDNAGKLANGRLGRYAYALGYEWGSFDTKVKSPTDNQNLSISSGHILYEGEIRIQPQKVPLSFIAYSRDLNRIIFSREIGSDIDVLGSNLTTSMQNGTRINSGATLRFGFGNGGSSDYGTIFNNMPMLFVDYQNQLVRDYKSTTPQDSSQNSFVFAAFSKHTGWLQYRQTRLDDHINRDSSYREDQYILGTVDHTLNRQWVDLTNWIKISADGQFTKRIDNQTGQRDTYDINLMAVASREKWEARTYNYFNRTIDLRGGRGVTNNVHTPVYIEGVWGPETNWKVRLASEVQKKTNFSDNSRSDRSDLLASVRVDTFKRSQFTLSPSLSVERFEQDGSKSVIVEGNVESASTRRFSNVLGLAASYNIKLLSQSVGTSTTDFYQQTITGRGIYKLSDALRFNLEEKITIANGSQSELGSTTIQFNADRLATSSDSITSRSETTAGFKRFTTTLGASWTPVARLMVGFTASEDIYLQENTSTDAVTSLTSSIEYTLPNFAIGSSVGYIQRTAAGINSSQISASGRASYTPNRNMKSDLRYLYSRVKDSTQDITRVDLLQRFTYTINKMIGRPQRVLDLIEELSYVNTTNSLADGSFDSKKRLTLGATYYPTRNLYVAATIRYSLLDPGNNKELTGTGEAGLNFDKLQTNIEYSYGKRSGIDSRVDKRFSANLKKQF